MLGLEIGIVEAKQCVSSFLQVCSELGLTSEDQVQALLAEIRDSYRRDRGRALFAAAFPDTPWPSAEASS